ncbi:hypothetical protein ACFWAN_54290 [Streptomyces mirabilis]|uniref:hypothetical protein n=1 Tax=Streptomyces mirabilis TaxID=68239 RepID=UPI0036599EDD
MRPVRTDADAARLSFIGGYMPDPEPSGGESSATFERFLDQALNSEQVRDALDRCGGALNREQLRTKALESRTAIAAAVAVEYQGYREARAVATERDGRQDTSGAATAGARGGGGLLPVLAVFVPSLAGVAAALFLLSGFGLRAFGGRPYIGEGLITAGLIAAAVAVGALIGDLVWLLMAAARNRPVAEHGLSGGAHPDVDQAREVWELALMERGILPFLLGRLEEGQVGGRGGHAPR